MKNSLILLAASTVLSILLLTSCKKDNPIIECVKYYDNNGLAVGNVGDCADDKDWEFIALSDKEQGYLDFQDNISLTNTQTIAITNLHAFPIPAALNETLSFAIVTTDTNKSVKVKMAITDTDNNVIEEIALLRVAQIPWQINLPDTRYNIDQHYRIHYQVSAEGNPNFFEGYGDFVICDTDGTGACN